MTRFDVLCGKCEANSVWIGHRASGSGVCLEQPLYPDETCEHLPDDASICTEIADDDE